MTPRTHEEYELLKRPTRAGPFEYGIDFHGMVVVFNKKYQAETMHRALKSNGVQGKYKEWTRQI